MKTETPRNYPLQWPSHRPRKTASQRQTGNFKRDRASITIPSALDRLEAELDRLGAHHVILSTNVEPRLDGRPRGGTAQPSDPGVCAYFSLAGKPFALACDTYSSVAQNIAALAAHVESTRAISRYGVASAEETLNAFSALPPPAAAPTTKPWREVLGFLPNFPEGLDAEDAKDLIQSRWKRGVTALGGPDGGQAAAVADINVARDQALAEIEE